jgi:hypothetical protein
MQMVIALAIFMVFDVLVDIAMNLQGSWISARRRVPVINRLHGLWSLGTVTGGLVAARSAAEGVPLFTHLTGASVAVAVLAYIVFRGLLKSDEEETLPPTGVSSGRTPARSVSTSLLVMLGFGGGFAVIMEFVGSDWAAFRLSDDLGASPGLATLGYVAFTSGMTIARFSGDSIEARIGADGLRRLAISAAFVGLASAAFISQPWVVLGAYVVAGLGIATLIPKLYDNAARFPGRRGTALGYLTAGSRLGGLAAPAIVGALASTALSVGDAIAIVTLPSAVGFGIVAAITRRQTQTAQSTAEPG